MALLIPLSVEREFALMPKADARRLRDRLEAIADAPDAHHANVRPLAGFPGIFRVRQGDWRAVFSIEEGDVTSIALRTAGRFTDDCHAAAAASGIP